MSPPMCSNRGSGIRSHPSPPRLRQWSVDTCRSGNSHSLFRRCNVSVRTSLRNVVDLQHFVFSEHSAGLNIQETEDSGAEHARIWSNAPLILVRIASPTEIRKYQHLFQRKRKICVACVHPDIWIVVSSAPLRQWWTSAIIDGHRMIRDDEFGRRIGRIGNLPNCLGPYRAIEILDFLQQEQRKIWMGTLRASG